VDHAVTRDLVEPGPRPEESDEQIVERSVLWAALSRDTTFADDLSTILSWDDSTLVRRLRLDLRAISRQRGAERPNAAPPDASGPDDLRRSRFVLLQRTNLIAIARQYAEPSSFVASGLVADSLWLERGVAAGIRFNATDDSLGITEVIDVVITPVGSLQRMDHSFETTDSPPNARFASTLSIVSIVVFFLLSALLLVVFFRQLIRRAIDVRAALIDSAGFSVVFVALILLSTDLLQSQMPTWMRVAAVAASLGIGGGAMALIVFLTSSAVDSLTRRNLAGKLRTVSLIRQGSLLNSYVGGAVVRGVALGFVALGCLTLCLAAFGDAAIKLDDTSFSSGAIQPFAAALAYSTWSAYFKSLMLVLTIGAITYKKGRPIWVLVIPVALIYGISGGTSIEFSSVWLSWFSASLIGIILALSFWYFDGFVTFMTLAVFSMMSVLQEGWLMAGSPFIIDAGLGGVAILAVLAFGFIGVSRGRPGASSLDYVPQYIREMGEQKQLQRELEIARQVQESFLPKTMPSFNGMDIAATCIPAEQVGGDYYDFVSLSPDRLGVALGDVSGKGIQAAFFMTLTKGFLRAACRETGSPAIVLDKINSLFRDSAPRGTFISLVYGILDTTQATFTFGRAGHNPVILKRNSAPASELLRPSGLGIGLAQPSQFKEAMAEQVIQMRPGDIVVLFTDGFSEARGLSHEEYGDNRLLQVVATHAADDAQQILDAVCADVVEFCKSDSTHDDRTVMVIKWPGTSKQIESIDEAG
jgi:hypothetical protein